MHGSVCIEGFCASLVFTKKWFQRFLLIYFGRLEKKKVGGRRYGVVIDCISACSFFVQYQTLEITRTLKNARIGIKILLYRTSVTSERHEE